MYLCLRQNQNFNRLHWVRLVIKILGKIKNDYFFEFSAAFLFSLYVYSCIMGYFKGLSFSNMIFQKHEKYWFAWGGFFCTSDCLIVRYVIYFCQINCRYCLHSVWPVTRDSIKNGQVFLWKANTSVRLLCFSLKVVPRMLRAWSGSHFSGRFFCTNVYSNATPFCTVSANELDSINFKLLVCLD